MKIKITFPQIVFESKEIEIDEEKFDELKDAGIQSQGNFIWHNMTENEQQWTNGKKWVIDAMDVGYASIKKVP